MFDAQTGKVMATHVAAVVNSLNNRSVDLPRIEQQSDTAPTGAVSGTTSDSFQTTTQTVAPRQVSKTTALLPAQRLIHPTKGMCAETGKTLTGIDHLKHSLHHIILTPQNQRVMLRSYGLDQGYLDQPGNRYQVMRLYSQLAEAINRWEPRLDLKRLSVEVRGNGQLDYWFEGDYLGQPVKLGNRV